MCYTVYEGDESCDVSLFLHVLGDMKVVFSVYFSLY